MAVDIKEWEIKMRSALSNVGCDLTSSTTICESNTDVSKVSISLGVPAAFNPLGQCYLHFIMWKLLTLTCTPPTACLLTSLNEIFFFFFLTEVD